ncbi:beta-ketoacyl synthase N-terminal-like domain-containing protein [Kribbella italica]|uniref:Coronafacic acid synthetase n=1 Tax=Kribbella italica TaxID=1540520 RepID=A0A7W9J4T2_9ACTN|nr:beta-ketoacyl synthase N-terminal-like domain-containing protein [Kribbella italica]MBB5835641.1 hypothetical protein [Kribbella italica]
MIDELPADLTVFGSGTAAQAVPNSTRRIPSLYVDPVAWLLLESAERAIGNNLDDVRGEVAVLVVSTYATLDTMAGIAGTATSGRVSPLRFAGASPGGAASLTCLVHGFRGPSLLLTSGPESSWPVAVTMARSWLRTGAAVRVILSVHTVDAEAGHQVRSVVVGASE